MENLRKDSGFFKRNKKNLFLLFLANAGFVLGLIWLSGFLLLDIPEYRDGQIHNFKKPLLDLQLGLTLYYVELPLELLFFWVTNSILKERSKEIADMTMAFTKSQTEVLDRERRIKQKEERIRELERRLNVHYSRDVMPVLSPWFRIPSPRSGHGQLFEEHQIKDASVVYWSTDGCKVTELSEPQSEDNSIKGQSSFTDKGDVKSAVEHLRRYGEQWDEWTRLKDRVNAHLETVKQTWQELEGHIQQKVQITCPELKIYHGSETHAPTSDYIHLGYLTIMVWRDASDFEHEILDELDHPDRITKSDRGYKVWSGITSGWDLVLCSKQESITHLKQCLTEVFKQTKISEMRRNLEAISQSLEADCTKFQTFLNNIVEEYNRTHEPLEHSCSLCDAELSELKTLKSQAND